jgi:hypothetical protein
MHRNPYLYRTASLFVLLICSSNPDAAPPLTNRAPGATAKPASQQPSPQPRYQTNPQLRYLPNPQPRYQSPQPRYLKAFVIDDRLSALRRAPSIQAEVLRRLRLARPVYIISTRAANNGQPKFFRVAVTRRTRGWIHAAALAVQGRTDEDQRIMNLIEETSDSTDKITLCRLVIERFGKSQLVPRAMLLLGQEAERVAESLSPRTHRRLAEVRARDARIRDYYLSDAGLDRFSRLGLVFDFDESTGEFIYDRKAYRDIVRRFPKSEEAKLARQRLDLASRKSAQAH